MVLFFSQIYYKERESNIINYKRSDYQLGMDVLVISMSAGWMTHNVFRRCIVSIDCSESECKWRWMRWHRGGGRTEVALVGAGAVCRAVSVLEWFLWRHATRFCVLLKKKSLFNFLWCRWKIWSWVVIVKWKKKTSFFRFVCLYCYVFNHFYFFILSLCFLSERGDEKFGFVVWKRGNSCYGWYGSV